MKEFLDTYREKFILDIKDFLKQDERNGFLIKRIPQMNIFVVIIYVMKKKRYTWKQLKEWIKDSKEYFLYLLNDT